MKSTLAVLRSVVSSLLIQGSGAFLLSAAQHALSSNTFAKMHGIPPMRLRGDWFAKMCIWQWFNGNLSSLFAEIKQRGVTTVDEQVAISRKFVA